jgi:hypothetical protein
VLRSYEARLAFIGRPFYRVFGELERAGELQVLDDFSNGVPAYDLAEAMRGCAPDQLEFDFRRRRWRIFAFSPAAHATLRAALPSSPS